MLGTRFDILDFHMSGSKTQSLCESIRNSNTITDLRFSSRMNGLGTFDYTCFQHLHLTSLEIDGCLCTHECQCLSDTCQHFTHLTTLRRLVLVSSYGSSYDHIFELFTNNTQLEDLEMIEFRDDHLAHILSTVNSYNLLNLRLCLDPEGPRSWPLVLSLVETTSTLESLKLNFCNLDNRQIHELATSLTVNTTLMSLGITSNTLKADGLKTLFISMGNKPELTHLDLSDCLYKNKEASHLFTLLQTNTTLQCLDVSYSIFKPQAYEDRTVDHLCLMLKHNTTLTSLTLPSLKINDDQLQRVKGVMVYNSTLMSIVMPFSTKDALKPIADRNTHNNAMRNVELVHLLLKLT